MWDDNAVPLFTEETLAAAADYSEEANTGTEAADGPGFSLVELLIGPIFEARAAPEPALDRDHTVP
jgi:hypothetical protein